MVKFSFHYDKDTHKAKLIIDGIPYMVDRIACLVPSYTARADVPPKFIVYGECDKVSTVFEQDGQIVSTLLNED